MSRAGPETVDWAATARFPFLSCDIFDTALTRILARPADILLAAGARARAQRLITCEPDAFAAWRLAAERAARAEAEAAGHDEVRIAEIYARLHACGIVADPIRAARAEFEAELAACRPIEACRRALAARAPETFVFASDTSLPADWLAELLAACGFAVRGPRIFASADLRRSKHTGRLFPAMLAALGRPASDIVHVGDNPVSDVARPRAHGIAARLAPRRPAAGERMPARHWAVRLADSRQRMMPTETQAGPAADGRALAAYAAPLVLGFGLHILAEARRLGIGRIYFLARDGYLPLAVIRRLLAATGAGDGFTLVYLPISRQAAASPLAKTYLDQAGFSAPGRRMVVDAGWRGSLQTMLAELAGLSADDVVGCYLGLWADALRPGFGPAQASGYLFAFGHPAGMQDCVREGYVVLELLFSAPHGTVLGYTAGADGVVHPEHEAPGDAADVVRVAAMQALEAACLACIDDLDALIGHAWPACIDARSALSPLAGLLGRPARAQVALVNRIPFIHTPGGTTLLPAVNVLPPREALAGPRRALKRLHDAPWRAGAVRAALPWPLPGVSFATLDYWAARLLGKR